ncbi:hypothetical protein E4631_21155 [Hymenobacter sp. UV11]|uniref:hypothetical protein n=1 Tax=Hymenobacter sp. UV11 TaxID=1849735 RepID=UPI00105FCE49|nr:hypothetical protein [Hymenobacter sp. UV11]TDN38812.1 hypothetical protein A8B98_21850 [Hymenobacter sp. UV11]TFZ63803.1 hypothetical protein E4631_21155 [Hymenobacter sp. UV11]
MRHRLLSESATLVLDYDALDDLLHARWGPEQTLASTQAGYEQILTVLPTQHCHRLLDDRRAAHLMWDELATWMATDWYPRAHAAGLLRHAVVFANDFFGHLATELVLARVAGNGHLVGFSSEAAARQMLLAA